MRYLLLLLICLYVRPAVAQRPLIRNVWLNDAATPVRVNAIVADAAQCIWLGAENGLYTYSGRDINLVSDSIREDITALAASGTAILYGTDQGKVYRYQAGRSTLLLHAKAAVSAIEHMPYGILIATLGDGAYFLSGTVSVHYKKGFDLPDDYVYRIAQTRWGWMIATDLGVFDAWPAMGRLATEKKRFGRDIARVVATDGAGAFWVGFQERGLGCFKGTGQDNLLITDTPWKWGQVNDILPTPAGNAWIATEDGYFLKARAEGQRLLVDTVCITGKKINRIMADRAGNIWLATDEGLTQVTAGFLSLIPAHGDFSFSKVTAVAGLGKDGFFYTQDQDVYQLHLATGIAELICQAPAIITCLYPDRHNCLWIGTGKGLFCRESNGTIKAFSDIPQLKDDHVLSLAGTADRIWLSGLNGVEELTIAGSGAIKDVKHHKKKEGIGSDYVYRIFIDSRHRIWFATDGAGISMYDGSAYHHWNEKQGFSSRVVYSIAEDNEGNIWVGTLDNGIYVYKDSWTHYGRAQGLQDQTITTLAADDAGHVLAISARGIDIWYPKDREFRHLNRSSRLGLDSSISDVLNIAANIGSQIYLPVQKGFLIFSGHNRQVSVKPSVIITGIDLYLEQLGDFRRRFRYDENYLGFHFKGINFSNPEPLFYRYRLDGLSGEWITTTDETITFPRLLPGKYRLVVQASLSKSFGHPAEAVYDFEIITPFWQRWWFIAIVLLIVSVIAYVLLQRRVRSLQKVARLEQERITFEYEYLKSQVNPHFLFNSLNTLVNLIEEDPNAAVNYTGQLSDLYRETLSAHEDDLVLLSDEWAVLNKYLYIQQNRFGKALQLVSSVPESVKQQRRIIPLALQLLVENAIKHNVVSTTYPLIIYIDLAGDALVVKNQIRLKVTPEKTSGIGLQNIRKRYALVTSRAVKIETRNNEFIVLLPLL